VDNAALHIGAVAFINRFDSSLNGRIHFHVCVVDGVFAEVAGKHWTSRNLPFVVVGYRCERDGHRANVNVGFGHSAST